MTTEQRRIEEPASFAAAGTGAALATVITLAVACLVLAAYLVPSIQP